jgi:dTDP-4-amino-4,6-dideoxygalactose transaminase
MEPILALARQHGLMVIEDCAQAFDGRGYLGDPEADVSMFSFGPIKTATALGGAMLRVRDRGLLDRMRARQAGYAVQKQSTYLWRLLKYAAFKALSYPMVYGMLVRVWRTMGRDYDRLVNGSVRGFPGPDFFDRIRQQPSAPLLAVLDRRLRTYERGRLECRAAKGEHLARLFKDKVLCAGRAATPHNSWVFPIVVENPAEVIAALRRAGFDATQGHSMCVVQPPAGRPQSMAPTAAELLARIVYLPIYPEIPERSLDKMAEVVLAVARSVACPHNAQRWAGMGSAKLLSMPTRGGAT